MPNILLTESRPGLEARAVAGKPGRQLIQLIDAGWGSSGYYSAEVLEAAAEAKVFPAGTHMYLDHPTESEEFERPERSVRDLAAVLVEDAYYDGKGALLGEVAVFGPYREVLAEMKDAIGVSIRASAKVTDGGTAEGRRGRIIDELVEAQSVDFVTKAGRGGRILQVMESAGPVGPTGISEATMRETEAALAAAIRDAYGGEKTWTWLRDFDESTAWFQVETPDDTTTYAQGYELEDGQVSLTGERTEVKQKITFVPVDAAEASHTTTEETAMSTSSTEGAAAATEAAATPPPTETPPPAAAAESTTTDSAATPVVEAAAEQAGTSTSTPEEQKMSESAGAGGAAPLGSPRQVLEARLQAQSDQIAQLVAKDRARDIIGEELAEAWVANSTKARLSSELIQSLPLTESKTLDEQALRARCVEARDRAELEAAETLNAAGVGTPRGLGAMTTPAGGDAARYEDSLAESMTDAFGLSESAAKTAVKGR